MADLPDLIEACRAQIAACRELRFAREMYQITPPDARDRRQVYRRYVDALKAARAATRVSDAAQSAAWDEMNSQPDTQPQLPW